MSDFIQLHVLTSYPPANLNRDDLGRPKTAIMGGTQRLRVSSQSLKRAWRTSEVFEKLLSGHVGIRTKDLGNKTYEALIAASIAPDAADQLAKKIAAVFGKVKGGDAEADAKPSKTRKKPGASAEGATEAAVAKAAREGRQIEQLVHVSNAEWAAIEGLIKKASKGDAISDDEIQAVLGDARSTADIGLFGRMLAANPVHNVEAAAQVAHAISVHKVTVEDDYFTAVDDLNKGEEDLGAGHIGTNEFAAALFYQYVCINRTLLLENLGGNEALASKAIKALAEAVATVAPGGKQATFGSRARASFMVAERGAEQPRSLSVAFLKSVSGDDFLQSAIQALKTTAERMDKVYGPCAEARQSFDAVAGEGTLAEILAFVGR